MSISTNDLVARRVRGIAAERRRSQADLASALRISKMSMSRRFAGVTVFTPDELAILARELEVPVGAFFDEAATPSAPSSALSSSDPDGGASFVGAASA